MAFVFRNPRLFWVPGRAQFGGTAGATWVARPIWRRAPNFILPLSSTTPAQATRLTISGAGNHMKANLHTPILTLLTAAISCALPLAAGATDQADTVRHYSSNFAPIVNKVREVVLGFSKKQIEAYSKAKTPCVTGPEFGAMGVHF